MGIGQSISDSTGNFGEIHQAGKDGRIFATTTLYGNSSVKPYNVLNNYNVGLGTERKFRKGAEFNWYKNGDCDDIPLIHRQIWRDALLHRSMVNTKANLVKGSGFDLYIPEILCIKNQDGLYEEVQTNLSETEKAALLVKAKLFVKNALLDKYYQDAANQAALYGGYYGFGYYNRKFDTTARGNKTFLRRARVERYLNIRQSVERDWVGDKFHSIVHYISDDICNVRNPNKILTYEEYILQETGKGYAGWMLADDGMVHQRNELGVYSKFVGNISEYRDYYATPDYESSESLSDFTTAYLLSQYRKNNVEGGFSLDHIVIRYRSKKADPAAEAAQKKKDVEAIRKDYKGVLGKKSSMMWVEPQVDANGKITSPDPIKIIEIPHQNNVDRYKQTKEDVTIGALAAHGIVTSEIVGLPSLTKTGFSSQSEYLIVALNQLYSNRIKPIQDMILADINERLISEGLMVQARAINSHTSLKTASDAIMQASFTLDEIRGEYGKAALTEEQREEIATRVIKNNNNEPVQ